MRKATPLPSPTPAPETIATLARQLWEMHGRETGRYLEYWLQARQQLAPAKTAGGVDLRSNQLARLRKCQSHHNGKKVCVDFLPPETSLTGTALQPSLAPQALPRPTAVPIRVTPRTGLDVVKGIPAMS